MNTVSRLLMACAMACLCVACTGAPVKRASSYEFERDNPLVHPPTQIENVPAPRH